MAKQRLSPSEQAIQDAEANAGAVSYVQFNTGDLAQDKLAMVEMSKAVSSYRAVARHDRLGFDPSNAGGSGVSGRYDFTNSDYEAFRPNERSVFKSEREEILFANLSYKENGLIRNVIDLMGDFGSQGIRLTHPNARIEKFYRNWFRKVDGIERSERFLNYLYRLGNVPVKMQTAKLKSKVTDKMYKSRGSADIEVTQTKLPKGEIPWKYTFLHPALIYKVGGKLANFQADPQFAVRMPKHIQSAMDNPTEDTSAIINSLPPDIARAIADNKPVLLDTDKFSMYYYKRDDWSELASPIIASIAIDLSLYQKLKLADRSALDGAISNIRIFTLGDFEHGIAPTAEAATKLANMLESNPASGTIDIIWGPDLKMQESNTNVHNFLGQAKYEPTLMAIYAGLGIPPTLTGTFGSGGTTNNFVSLKTLIQRLEYGRDILTGFWEEQIALVQEAMGFRFPARVEFDLMNLGDESSEKALLVQLSDRQLISDELLQEYFGSDPEMENIRIAREQREREKGSRVEKAGPFHNPQQDEDLEKIALQQGDVTPGEVGLELEPKKDGEKSRVEIQGENDMLAMKQKKEQMDKKPAGVSGQGRPKNSTDTTKRKTKTFKPKIKAFWAKEALNSISTIINPAILALANKKDMRSLDAKEFEDGEILKFGVLCNLTPMSKISDDSIKAALNQKKDQEAVAIYKGHETQMVETLGRKLSIEERKIMQAFIYAEINETS